MDHVHPQGDTTGRPPGPGFETRDTNVRAVVGFGVGLVVLLVVVMTVLLGIMKSVASHRDAPRSENAPTDVIQELKRLRADEKAALESYGPIKDEPGYARVPIDRAMDLLVKKGVPFGKGRKSEVQINTRIKP